MAPLRRSFATTMRDTRSGGVCFPFYAAGRDRRIFGGWPVELVGRSRGLAALGVFWRCHCPRVAGRRGLGCPPRLASLVAGGRRWRRAGHVFARGGAANAL